MPAVRMTRRAAGRGGGKVLQQCGLADPRLAMQDPHLAASLPRFHHQPVQQPTLVERPRRVAAGRSLGIFLSTELGKDLAYWPACGAGGNQLRVVVA